MTTTMTMIMKVIIIREIILQIVNQINYLINPLHHLQIKIWITKIILFLMEDKIEAANNLRDALITKYTTIAMKNKWQIEY